MFRVRNWTGEEINSGRGDQTKPEKRQNASLRRGDTSPVVFTRGLRVLKAADGRREATKKTRGEKKKEEKTGAWKKSCKVRQRRRVELMFSATWRTVAG